MRRRSTALAIAGVVLHSSQVGCTSPNDASIDSIVSSFLCTTCGGVAVAVVRDGHVVLKKGYGPANMERNTPITSDTVFDLASLGKQFTGMALLIRAERGKLLMEDDVRKYLPEVPVFDPHRPIKMSDLSQHTSGLPEFKGSPETTEAAIFAWLSNQRKLDFPTGSRWEYPNLNYFLLARIVERLSGKKLRLFLDQEVFTPAGMKDAQVLDQPDGLIRKRATGYCFGKPCRLDDGIPGAGGVFASLNDMIAWDAALTHGTLVRPDVLIDALKLRGYALGWGITTNAGHRMMWHDGDSIGARTYIARYLDNRLTIILLSNQTRLDVDNLHRKIALRFL